MNTLVLKVKPASPSPAVLRRAARVLRDGGLVAFPTETVYGLGGLADESLSVLKIFAAKGRPAHNPLIAHVHDLASARALASEWSDAAEAFAQEFWPGPLTLVVPRKPSTVCDEVSAGGSSVAVRCPAHPVALGLLRELGRPLAAPSANLSQRLSPTTAAHVLKSLNGRIDMVLDGGPCALGIESTVLDLRSSPPVILRPGALGIERMRSVCPEVRERSVAPDASPLASPGMLQKHYAPRAILSVVPHRELLARCSGAAPSRPIGVITESPELALFALPWVYPLSLGESPEGYAQALFASLHRLDELGCEVILVAELPETPGWTALRDRLTRASSR